MDEDDQGNMSRGGMNEFDSKVFTNECTKGFKLRWKKEVNGSKGMRSFCFELYLQIMFGMQSKHVGFALTENIGKLMVIQRDSQEI